MGVAGNVMILRADIRVPERLPASVAALNVSRPGQAPPTTARPGTGHRDERNRERTQPDLRPWPRPRRRTTAAASISDGTARDLLPRPPGGFQMRARHLQPGRADADLQQGRGQFRGRRPDRSLARLRRHSDKHKHDHSDAGNHGHRKEAPSQPLLVPASCRRTKSWRSCCSGKAPASSARSSWRRSPRRWPSLTGVAPGAKGLDPPWAAYARRSGWTGSVVAAAPAAEARRCRPAATSRAKRLCRGTRQGTSGNGNRRHRCRSIC